MKLCISKPDGSTAEVMFSDKQPFFNRVNNELLLFENYLYKLVIREDEAIDNAELFVGDYSVPLIYNMSNGCYETEKGLIFGGCFDLVCVSISFDNDCGEEKIYYTDYLRIATTKQTARQVEHMLGEIENNLPNFLEICFSHSRKKSGLIKNDIRSIWNTLKVVDEIINIYEENYGYFSNHKKSSVEQIAAIVDVKSMRKISQESLVWIASNPDNLVCTDKESVIKIDEKKYAPSKIKTYISQYSYNVYENKVVLGFIKGVINYIEDQIAGFNHKIMDFESIPESIVVQLPNTHELTGRCIYIYYKGVVEQFCKRKEILQDIFYHYERVLNCVPEIVQGTPKLTNTFKQVYHYRLCYECIVKWFEAGDYSFDHLNYLFNLKTLSRIFEYYCLIKLQTAIVQSGYSLVEANRVIYDVEDELEDINNQYIFTGRGQELILLYEPSIWVDKMNADINLYSTGYNFSKCKWNDRWTPDFVLKIVTGIKEYYYILDAKYSNAMNVKKRYIPELVLKYSAQIASKDKFFSDVIGVGAIYPGNEDKMYYFKKNGVHSRKQSLPKYFSLSIVGEESGTAALKERIIDLLEIVDILEEESKPFIEKFSSTNVIDEQSVTDIVYMDESSEMKNDAKAIDKPSDSNGYTTTKVLEIANGKKCFYYAKGMCLSQKLRCNIIDEPCGYYVQKSSRELLEEEDTCRNLIRYMRKGKVNRVECSVSGLSGCVGHDNCKFYLKKKQSKK